MKDFNNETIVTFDHEATYGKSYGRVSNPFDPSFHLVSTCYKTIGTPCRGEYFVKEDADGHRTGGHNNQTSDWGVPEGTEPNRGLATFITSMGGTILIGHNIKFDLLWSWDALRPLIAKGLQIWDTAYAQYLLSAQFYNLKQIPNFRPSLDVCLKSHNLALKDDAVKALWEDGWRTEDIDEDTMMKYNVIDVEQTEALFASQWEQAKKFKLLPMIQSRMDGVLATTEMEYNGLMIDMVEAEKRTAELTDEVATLEERLCNTLPSLPFEFNFGSSKQLSALLFGGSVKYIEKDFILSDGGTKTYPNKTEKWPLFSKHPINPNIVSMSYISLAGFQVAVLPDGTLQDRTKTGKNAGTPKFRNIELPDLDRPKMKLFDRFCEFPRLVKPEDHWKEKKPKDALKSWKPSAWSTGAEVLEELELIPNPPEILKALLEWRNKEKDLGTYYKRFVKGEWKGMLTMVNPHTGRIHHGLNHYVTKTARLSSSNPNLQNVSSSDKSEVKKLFVSRFGEKGKMVEADYSQLEVVTKAVLSGDEQLRLDLENGVCFHCKNLSLSPLAEGKSYEECYRLAKTDKVGDWPDRRQQIKAFTFASAYGAGAKSMAKGTGMSVEAIQELMKAKESEYWQEAAYDKMVMAKVQASRRPSMMRTKDGNQAGMGWFRSVTGTTYHFIESDAPKFMKDKGIAASFTPTQPKNFPSQGLGGEIMQVMLGKIFRYIINLPAEKDSKIKLINTVHDSCWIDAHEDVLFDGITISMIQALMSDVSRTFKEIHGEDTIKWTAAFPVDIEMGDNLFHGHDFELQNDGTWQDNRH
jgi:DNA polymerase-1